MSAVRRTKYAAGLWSDSIIDDLLWRAGRNNVRPNWRAPTWSWASAVPPVYYSDAPIFWDPDEAIEDRPPFEHIATVLDIQTRPKFQDEFGELDAGELCLRSRCAKATLRYWGPNEVGIRLKAEFRAQRGQKSMTYAVQMGDGSGYQIISDYALEKPSPDFVPSGMKVLCVLISVESESNISHPYRALNVLVLIRAGEEEERYKRIALCVISESKGCDVNAVLESFPEEMKDLSII
jgi:hypothetical protein